jgi:hypothetical protein
MLFLLPGTRLSVFGSYQPVPPLDDLLVTPMMSSPFLSLPIIDKSFQDQEIVLSSCGTPLATANSPSPRRDTLSGFLASDSAPTLKTLSLSVAVGTSWSRSVNIFHSVVMLQECRFI